MRTNSSPPSAHFSRTGFIFGFIVPLLAGAYLIYVGYGLHQTITSTIPPPEASFVWNVGDSVMIGGAAVILSCVIRAIIAARNK